MPKPPAMTEMNERFIAWHMMYDRYAPDEPTSAPVTMSRSLLSRKPDAAAAQPEKLFSIDTTTGMSPPPMDATMCHPRNNARTVTAISNDNCGVMTYQTFSAAKATSEPRLMKFWPGSIIGADFIRADSLRNATIEPVNVTAPMK